MALKTVGRYVLVLILAIVLTYAYASRKNLLGKYMEHEQREAQVNAASQQCEALAQEIQAARQRITSLHGDPEELEDVIRRTENRIRPGETVYRLEKVPEQTP